MFAVLADILQDIRFAQRTLRANPAFTIAALVTLTLGIGCNTAIFSVIDAAWLHPIPFPQSERLVSLWQKYPREPKNAVSYPNLLDWQQRSKSFTAIAGVREDTFTLTGRGEPEQLMGSTVSWNLLGVLGIHPVAGRMFTQQEDQHGGAPVLLLGEDFWRRRFAGDPKIMGTILRLSGRDYTVIGIMPASVRFDRAPGTFFNDVFTPIAQNPDPLFFERGIGDNTFGLARLQPGVALSQARAEMDVIARNLATEYPKDEEGSGITTISYREDIAGDLRPVLLALGAAVGFVLLIACTNVANLMLARAAGRSSEFGVRVALGAGRVRLIRQLLTESVLLSLISGALGLLLASWLTGAALAVMPSVLPAISEVRIDGRVLAFVLGVSLGTGVLFGLAPAWRAAGTGLNQTLRQGGRGVLAGRRRAQSVLVIAEIALTLVLLTGAGLILRSLHNLWNVNPGFNPQNVTAFFTSLPPQRAATPEKTREALSQLQQRLSGLPGVESAGLDVGGLPFLGNTGFGFRRSDAADSSKGSMQEANVYWVSASHFQTLGIPLLRGRGFAAGDTASSPLVAVMDEETARRVFPDRDPLGQSIVTGLSNQPPIRVVGIAGRVKHGALDPDATARQRGQLYFPISQTPEALLPLAASGLAGIVRSNTAPSVLMPAIRKEMNAFDGGAVFGERSMTAAIEASLGPRRFSLIVLMAFGATALILAFTGIYGVVSYFVAQRTNEIGVRMTLGARPQDIVLSILKEGSAVAGLGVLLGLGGAAALTRLVSSLLFEVNAVDLPTYAGAAALLFLSAMLACYIPARRATEIDPAAALRSA